MKRRLFTILSAFSLLLFVAVVVMWVRSYFREDALALTWRTYVTSRTGAITVLAFDDADIRPEPPQRYGSGPVGENAELWDSVWSGPDTGMWASTIGYGRGGFAGMGRYTLVLVLDRGLPGGSSARGVLVPPAMDTGQSHARVMPPLRL